MDAISSTRCSICDETMPAERCEDCPQGESLSVAEANQLAWNEAMDAVRSAFGKYPLDAAVEIEFLHKNIFKLREELAHSRELCTIFELNVGEDVAEMLRLREESA